MIGQIINYRYEVLEKIGDGDIFSVYKARDKVLNRLVALKSLTQDCADNAAFRRSVRAGYQAVTQLDHPFIARVMDADPASEDNFVACEYVHGINVKERVKRVGSIQVPTALDIIIPVLEALEYAHANRVIHGDLRPQDVVVSSDGEVKVTDFGLSSALRACPDVADRFGMRSVHYEAPEIAEGADPSVSSDLYSVGVILYEMLTGQLPFDGPTAISIALKQAKDIPATPRSINTAVPKSLSDLVMRAIEKSPLERFPSASAMLEDLRQIRDALRIGKPVSVPQPSMRMAEQYDEDKPEGVLSKASYVWLTLIFVLVIAAVTGITYRLSMRDSKIEVPYLLGLTVDQAREKAREANLTLEEDELGDTYSNDYEEGTIAIQFPEAHAKVPQDKNVIKYRLSKGSNSKMVPDIVGMPETEAVGEIESAGFKAGEPEREWSDRPEGQVIKQDPDKGTMAPVDTEINFTVSKGPKMDNPLDESSTSEPDGTPRSFQVSVEVPEDAAGEQEVKIVLNDSRGETTPYLEYRQAGDTVNETVTAYGDKVHIKVYVGGRLVYDKSY